MGIRFVVQPRMVAPEKVARRLGVTVATFETKRVELEAIGFPKPVPVLGTYCLQAVDNWIDAKAGLTPASGGLSDRSVIAERLSKPGWGK